ncbi:MAG TPA: hypothetical protein VNC84_03400 [Gammaproteobacteria bacterium]|jgi:hypothetical protein|nr:hypothetical protein [Gammaproteobacteria bacterium]
MLFFKKCRWFFTGIIVVTLFAFQTSAHAEYYLVGGQCDNIQLRCDKAVHKKHHTKKQSMHHRHYAKITEYIIWSPNTCGCCTACTAMIRVKEERYVTPYPAEHVVYYAMPVEQEYYWYGSDDYNADLTTGDDNVMQDPDMDGGY